MKNRELIVIYKELSKLKKRVSDLKLAFWKAVDKCKYYVLDYVFEDRCRLKDINLEDFSDFTDDDIILRNLPCLTCNRFEPKKEVEENAV